jgi:3-deoxy-D-manno-octulosonic-acid transferase
MRFRGLLRRMLANIDLFLAQSEEDARRLIEIGAARERVEASGNLKFEVKPPAKSHIVTAIQSAIQNKEVGPVIVAGSTLEGEEAMLLEMLREVQARFPETLLVLAPRHPQRFDVVAGLVDSRGTRFRRRSQWEGQPPIEEGVFLLDSIGELAALYQFADLAFIGGSLVPRGGHNVIEAAQFGVPILVGPHTENFRDIIEIFHRADALRVVTPQSLAPTVLHLLQDSEERAALGQRALAVMRSQQGATEKTVSALLRLVSHSAVAAEVHAESRR